MNLFDHQKVIVDEDPKQSGIWLGTGGGKTRIALMLAEGKTLVICPKTQKLDGNWMREWILLRTEDHGPRAIEIMSKEEFRRDHELLKRFDTVIVDEAETCLGVTPSTRQRNRRTIPKASQLFEALESFLERTKPTRLYLCTATITRSPMTVWGAGKLLGKHWDFFKWRQAFYTRLPMPGREVWSPKTDSATKDRLAAAVRQIGYVGRLSDWFDVPEQTFRDVFVDITMEQKKRIKELTLEFPDPIVRIGKRHQIENGSLRGDEYSDPEFFKNGKLEKILDFAAEFPKMVIFAKYTEQIRQLGVELTMAGYKVLTLTGATKDRETLFKDANASEACIVIAQAQISAGWELPDFPCMVFASRTYSIADYEQSLGRIQRVNNIKKNLYINLIAKGGVDEAVHKALENKKDFSERVYAGI